MVSIFVVSKIIYQEVFMKGKTLLKTVIIFVVIAAFSVLLFVGLTLFKNAFGSYYDINNNLFDDEYVTQTANLSNGGFACEIDGNVYYSDGNTGIYIDSDDGPQLFMFGRYSNLVCFNGKLYCNRYTSHYDEEDIFYIRVEILSIECLNGDVDVIYTASRDAVPTLFGVIQDKLYFSVSEDDLFYIDTTGNVIDTGLHNVVNVTKRGIYVRKLLSSGLQLLSFDKELIETYDYLDPYKVDVLFDNGDDVYIKCHDEDYSTTVFATISLDNGEWTGLNNSPLYGNIDSINIFGESLYIVYCYLRYDGIYQYTLCTTDLAGTSPDILGILETESNAFYPTAIVDNKIYSVFPYSNCEMFITELTENFYVNTVNSASDETQYDYDDDFDDEDDETDEVEAENPVEVPSPPFFEPYPDNFQAVVTPVVEKTTIYGSSFSGDILYKDQDDIYLFSTYTAGVYNFAFDLSDANAYIDFYIYDEKNKCLNSGKYRDGGSISVTLDANKCYEIYISQNSGYVTYTVDIGIPNPPQMVYSNSFSGTIDFKNKKDTYIYTATSTGMHNFAFSLSDVNVSGKFYVYNKKNSCLVNIGFSDEKNTSVELQAGETYTIYIAHSSGYADYSVTISTPNPVTTLYGNVMSGTLSYPRQIDTYLYTAPLSGKYNLSFDLDEYIAIEIYDEKKSTVLEAKISGGDKTINLVQGKVYTIDIRYQSSPTDYNITITVPKAVQKITDGKMLGRFDFKGQVDNYEFTAPYSGTYGFDFSTDGAVKMFVIDENDDWLLESTYFNDSKTKAVLAEGKTYKIQITQNSAKKYDITINMPNPIEYVGLGTVNGDITFKGQRNQYYFTPGSSRNYTFTFDCSSENPYPKFIVMQGNDYIFYETVRDGNQVSVELEANVVYSLMVEQNSCFGKYSFTIS